MDKMIFCVLVAVVTPCLSMKSWELPKEDLFGSISPELHEPWMRYMKSFNKTYGSAREEITRRLFWEDNYRFIHEHNEKYDRGESTFYLGENEMADMAEDEVQKVFLSGLIIPEVEPEAPVFTGEGLSEPPLERDWRRNSMVTPVRNQGRCGSCWAFSAVGALEGYNKRKTGRLVPLSAQDLVDCSRRDNLGCNGGWMNSAFDFVKSRGGIDSEKCYPYFGKQRKCKSRRACQTAKTSGFTKVAKNERALKKASGHIGPLSIAIDANYRPFMYYKGGVYYEPSCRPYFQPNHAMTLIGYGGSRRKNKYWIIKNSWGKCWGVDGIIYMGRNKRNNCRIADFASFPY